MKTLLQAFAVIFVLPLLLAACGERQEDPLPALTYRQREIVDTLYLERVTTLRPMLDSICEAEHEARVARAVDSLLQVRMAEEARLRARIFQEQINQ